MAKEALLELSGFSLNKCADNFFNPRKWHDMTIINSISVLSEAFNQRSREYGRIPIHHGDETHCLACLTKECAAEVLRQKPIGPEEFVKAVQEYQDLHGNVMKSYSIFNPRWEGMGQQRIDISKQITPIVQKTQNEMRDTQITCFTCGLPGHKANVCQSSNIQTKKDDFRTYAEYGQPQRISLMSLWPR